MPKRFSTARGREFGDGLRAAIAGAGLSSRAAAELADWDEARLSELVNGKGGSSEVELALLLGICRTKPAERDHLMELFPETHIKGWWQEHGTCEPVRLRTFVENLAVAKTLISWQTHIVPDLLQTDAYRRAVITASANVSVGELEERVKAGLEMQQALLRPGLQSTFFLHEFALRLPVGGHDVHAEQVHHLLRTAVRSNITIRIVPAAIGAHAGMRGPFTQLTFAKYEPLVCLRNENSTLFVEEKAAIKGYEAVVRSLDHISLDAERSRAVIARLGEALSAGGCANEGHDWLASQDDSAHTQGESS
ncbi:helix-turn-helix transcriptional regulator [Lentzea roselyniae]|uniref:Helix-turn-helix transcriptional regulator n=1 Tax=Lentzea roselyniae TaxID=531940 RepID=A0ABP7C823_9PSEU